MLEQESDSNENDKKKDIKSKMDSKKTQNNLKNKSANNKNLTESKSKVDNKSRNLNATTRNSNVNEYETDTSDEEDIRNTVGNIPMKWYNNADHLGYDWDGKKILKPEQGDMLDNFLKRMEDPDFWRTIKDYQTGQDVVLSEADIDLITRIQKQRIPDAKFDEYAVSEIKCMLNNYISFNIIICLFF